jgi:cobalamin biosynthesis protein CobD/CbiB
MKRRKYQNNKNKTQRTLGIIAVAVFILFTLAVTWFAAGL